MGRIKIEDIQSSLEKIQWKVISQQYQNLDSEMVFKCPEGHTVYSTWKKIRNKAECPICKNNKYKEQEQKIIPKKKGIKRIFALDQATYITGYSIYDGSELVKFGIFETQLDDEIKRDNELKQWFINMVNTWKPDHIGLEDIQLQNFGGGNSEFNPKNGVGLQTYKVLAHLQGILMETCYELNLTYTICSPASWRAHCNVKGKTKSDKKKSMQINVKEWFDISVTNDEADAIGIGKYVADSYNPKPEIISWE